MSAAVPLFDEVARDGRQGELASIIRRATRIQPLGPNSQAVHSAGGTVHLTPAEAEEAARAVLESDWLRGIVTRHVAEALDKAAERIEAGVLPTHPNQGYRDGFARAAQIVREVEW